MRKDTKIAGALMLAGSLALGIAANAGAVLPSQHVGTSAPHAKVTKVTTKKVTFSGSYHGNIALLMVGPTGQSATSVKVTSVSGNGTGTLLGASRLTATGSAPASNQCDELSGLGRLSGAGSTLNFKVVTSTKSEGCAAGTATPTSVSVSGIATVTSGTGKYKGAAGTLTFKGNFNVNSNNAGSNESDAFTATLTGHLTVKN